MADTGNVDAAVATAEVCFHTDRSGFYVFWTTDTAYGSRGEGLTETAAEKLAARIREDGPYA